MTECVLRVYGCREKTTDPVVERIDQITRSTLLTHYIQTATKSYTTLPTEPSQPVIPPFVVFLIIHSILESSHYSY